MLFFRADQIDSVRLVTDSTGAIAWQATYNPFGEELSTQNSAIRFQFGGMEYDSEDNLNHTEFRQYASAQGRWMSPDPYSGSLEVEQSAIAESVRLRIEQSAGDECPDRIGLHL